MSDTKYNLRIGITWDNINYKDAYAIITKVDSKMVYYDYFYGHNDTGNYGDRISSNASREVFMAYFKPKSISIINKLNESIDKLRNSL